MCLLLCRGLELAHSRCSKQLRVRGCWLALSLPLALCCEYVPASVARTQGYGLTYVLMFARIRLGLHKHAKEGLACLLESCTQREYERVGGCCILGSSCRILLSS